jgi:Mn-dependent DtxR family transcriptional regulator
MKIHESAENYLETILVLSKKIPNVRSIDIVNEMHFSKPSVSVAMRNLRADGYILVNEDGYITLTDSGREIAEMIYERHRLLKNLLMSIGVDEAIAAEDACRIEHVISKESFEALKQHVWDEHQIDADTQI